MKTYKVTQGPHYDADETMATPELTRNSFYILFITKGESYKKTFLAVSTFVESCSLTGRAL